MTIGVDAGCITASKGSLNNGGDLKMSKKNKKSSVPSQRPVDYLRARPWVRRQLGEAPALMLFWRDGPADSRQGMLWALSTCPSPDCPCRDVFVQAISVTDSVIWAQLDGEGVQTGVAPDPKGLAGPHMKRSAFAKVNVATGAVNAENGKPNDAEMLDWLKEELNGAVLAALRGVWNTVRKRPADAAIPPEQP